MSLTTNTEQDIKLKKRISFTINIVLILQIQERVNIDGIKIRELQEDEYN